MDQDTHHARSNNGHDLGPQAPHYQQGLQQPHQSYGYQPYGPPQSVPYGQAQKQGSSNTMLGGGFIILCILMLFSLFQQSQSSEGVDNQILQDRVSSNTSEVTRLLNMMMQMRDQYHELKSQSGNSPQVAALQAENANLKTKLADMEENLRILSQNQVYLKERFDKNKAASPKTPLFQNKAQSTPYFEAE